MSAVPASPLISVIITSYNYLHFITQAIDSARAQTYPNIEIVVSDNCSTDGTVPALRERYAGDSRVRIFENEANLGEIVNSNRGFERSTGDFVMWLSADDWMYPHHLERLHQTFERAPFLDVVYSGAYFANEVGVVYTQRMRDSAFPFDYVDARDELVEMFTSSCPMCWPTALFRRSVFLDIGPERPEDGIHATDWELQIRMALAGKRFGYLAEPSLAIRMHDAQETGAAYHAGPRRLVDFLLILEMYLDHPGMQRLRGREASVAGFLRWMVDDTVAAGGPEVITPDVRERVAAVTAVLEARASAYEPARVHEQRVSVLLPVARSPVLAARAIDSVVRQTLGNWEIVLVDHGTISLRDLLDAHPQRERISYVRSPASLLPGRAYNLALRMARGEYLAFLSETNTFAPEHLATLADAISRSGGSAAAASARLVLEVHDPRFLHVEQIGDVGIFRGPDDPPELSLVADALPLDALLVYRRIRDRVGGFREIIPLLADYEFLVRAERDAPITLTPTVTVDVRAGIDLGGTLGPNLGHYLPVLDAVYREHPAPQLDGARKTHRAAVEHAIGKVAGSGTITAQAAAEFFATLAGHAVRPLLAAR